MCGNRLTLSADRSWLAVSNAAPPTLGRQQVDEIVVVDARIGGGVRRVLVPGRVLALLAVP